MRRFYCEEANNCKLHSVENIVYTAADSHRSEFWNHSSCGKWKVGRLLR